MPGQDAAIFEGSLDYLRLNIAHFEDPDDDDWDSNVFLVAPFEAMFHGRKWAVSDYSMIGYEAEQLADWLEALPVGASAPEAGDISDIRFDKLSEGSLRIRFFDTAAPPWLDKKSRKAGECQFEVPIDKSLKVAATQLRNQLKAAKDKITHKPLEQLKRERRRGALFYFLTPAAILTFFAFFTDTRVRPVDYIFLYPGFLLMMILHDAIWGDLPQWMKFWKRRKPADAD